MSETRLGRQTPVLSVVLPYQETKGAEAIEIYNKSGRTAQQWQELMMYDIMALDDDGHWLHMKFGWSVPRRNGKSEILCIRAEYGVTHGERMPEQKRPQHQLTKTMQESEKKLLPDI